MATSGAPKVSKAHREVLEAVGKLKLADREAERRSGIAQSFLAKARKGQREGPGADSSWAKLKKLAFGEAVGPAAPPAASAPSVATGEPTGLVIAIRSANTLELLDDLAKRVLEEIALERVEAGVGRALTDLIRERRQLLVEIAKERSASHAGQVLRVEVFWTEEWRSRSTKGETDGEGDDPDSASDPAEAPAATA